MLLVKETRAMDANYKWCVICAEDSLKLNLLSTNHMWCPKSMITFDAIPPVVTKSYYRAVEPNGRKLIISNGHNYSMRNNELTSNYSALTNYI